MKENFNIEQVRTDKWRESLDEYLFNPFRSIKMVQPIKTPKSYNNTKKIDLNIKNLNDFDWKGLASWRQSLLNELHDYLSTHHLIKNRDVCLQFIGSIGSGDVVNYSDFDCIVILPLSTSMSDSKLRRVKGLIRKLSYYAYVFSEYQHHGIFVMTEAELLKGSPSFYPIKLFQSCWGYGLDCFYIRTNSTLSIDDKNLDWTVNWINSELTADARAEYSIFAFYNLLSVIFLMPAYYLNTKGIYLDKRESIERVIELQKEIESDFLTVSSYRKEWPNKKNYRLRMLIYGIGLYFWKADTLAYFYRAVKWHFLKESRISSVEYQRVARLGQGIAQLILKEKLRKFND
jgi:hypothetical protein